MLKFIRTTYQGGGLFKTTAMKIFIAKTEENHGDEKITEVEMSCKEQ